MTLHCPNCGRRKPRIQIFPLVAVDGNKYLFCNACAPRHK